MNFCKCYYIAYTMARDQHSITWIPEKHQGSCSDTIKHLATAQFKHTTISYTLVGQDPQGVKYCASYEFEKPSVAAKKIEMFMQDPALIINAADKQQESQR